MVPPKELLSIFNTPILNLSYITGATSMSKQLIIHDHMVMGGGVLKYSTLVTVRGHSPL
jgi:hypothetical protein